jgi:hypothetical protein
MMMLHRPAASNPAGSSPPVPSRRASSRTHARRDSMVRSLWPAAPLAYQADDGKVVGLLLAEVTRRDHQFGISFKKVAQPSRHVHVQMLIPSCSL